MDQRGMLGGGVDGPEGYVGVGGGADGPEGYVGRRRRS